MINIIDYFKLLNRLEPLGYIIQAWSCSGTSCIIFIFKKYVNNDGTIMTQELDSFGVTSNTTFESFKHSIETIIGQEV